MSSRIPAAADIAKKLLGEVARGGGAMSADDLARKLSDIAGVRVSEVQTDREKELLRGNIADALRILQQRGSVTWDGQGAQLTDQGWEQSRALQPGAAAPTVTVQADDAQEGLDLKGQKIDVTESPPTILFVMEDGRKVDGLLNKHADRIQGDLFEPPASALLDRLYDVSVVDGEREARGFYSTLKKLGVNPNPRVLLESTGKVRFYKGVSRGRNMGGYSWPAQRDDDDDDGIPVYRLRSSSTPKKPRWASLLCEVLARLGGHAEWKEIDAAVSKRRESRDFPGWREETRQALKNNTEPYGQRYFTVAEVGSRAVYALTDAGRKLASRRAIDNRAPTLSKYIAQALYSQGTAKLTDYEIYALMHLAIELKMPAEARSLYERLREDFPDEDTFHMIEIQLERAGAT